MTDRPHPRLSIVLPLLNEADNAFLAKIARSIPAALEIEVICVSGSEDLSWWEAFSGLNPILVQGDYRTRAERLSVGVSLASGEMILLHHPRSVLQKGAFELLLEAPDLQWGGFWHKFDRSHPALRMTSLYSNLVRGRIKSLFYLDHCIFLSSELAQKVFPLPSVDIFEDTILCRRLCQVCRGSLLPAVSTTSSIRYSDRGVFRQFAMNQYMKLCFYLGFEARSMNERYESKLRLNS